MSKSTKVIAALGVAAGLGVAALPAATFATDAEYTGKNNGTALTDGDGTANVVPFKLISKAVLALDVESTGDLVKDSGLTLVAGTSNTGASQAASSVLKATSNNLKGWKITVAGTASTNGSTLKAASYDQTDGNKATIAPFTGDGIAKDDLATTTTGGWGILLDGASEVDLTGSAFNGTHYKGMSENANVVVRGQSSGSETQTYSSITANYGIHAASNLPADTYTGSITYTIAEQE